MPVLKDLRWANGSQNTMCSENTSSDAIRLIFEPRSIAIIGASRAPGKVGHVIARHLIDAGFKGKLFMVNPKVHEILGLRSYPSVEDVPDAIDLGVVAVPAPMVPQILEECARKKIKSAIVISGGFREMGKEGEDLEKRLVDIVNATEMRLVGPNCMGVDNPYVGMSMWILLKKKGPIGIVTQSGTVGSAIECWAEKDGIGISKYLALGNKIDVNEMDVLRYYEQDPDTRVIVMYLEGVSDGRNFMQLASKISRKKPMLVLKGGRTQAGLRAAISHTRSMVGKDEIFDAACRQSGITRVSTLEELYDFSKAFSFLQLPKGRGVLVITSSGGAGILAADGCDRFGLELPAPSGSVVNRLRKVLPPQCVFSNPFDLTTTTSERFQLVMEENLNAGDIHAFLPIFGDPLPRAAEAVKKVSEKTEKPIVVCYVAGAEVEDVEKAKMQSMGIPVFPTPERAVAALHALVRRYELLKNT